MSDQPLLTIEQLAAVLRVPVEMTRQWETDGLLPVEDVPDGAAACYRQLAVVSELRKHPEVMDAIKSAMRARRGVD